MPCDGATQICVRRPIFLLAMVTGQRSVNHERLISNSGGPCDRGTLYAHRPAEAASGGGTAREDWPKGMQEGLRQWREREIGRGRGRPGSIAQTGIEARAC
jgi:hypothetical protein